MDRHVPVLLEEVIEQLALAPGQHIIDCTVGDAGHSEKILQKIAPDGKLLAIDADPESLLRAKQFLYQAEDRVMFVRRNFSELASIVDEHHFHPVHGVLMDLGWSSPQFADRSRGFSFQQNEPLDMRFSADVEDRKTAADIVNTYSAEDLQQIFRQYGEEPQAQRIANAIITARKEKRIETTGELVDIIISVKGKQHEKRIHPATQVFQALRIEVNEELDMLKKALPQAVGVLEAGGRLAVITFHSLEDRIVKHFFKGEEGRTLALVNKKPITAGEEELVQNPRARSAKLRVVEKI